MTEQDVAIKKLKRQLKICNKKVAKAEHQLTAPRIPDRPTEKNLKLVKEKIKVRKNPWLVHLAQYKSDHPELTYKQAMAGAKPSYTKVKPVYVPKKKRPTVIPPQIPPRPVKVD